MALERLTAKVSRQVKKMTLEGKGTRTSKSGRRDKLKKDDSI